MTADHGLLARLCRAWEQAPGAYGPNRDLGLFMAMTRRYELPALPYLERALALDPPQEDLAPLLHHLAAAAVLDGDFDKAAEAHRTLADMGMAPPENRLAHAQVLTRLGRRRKAESLLAGLARDTHHAAADEARGDTPPLHLFWPPQVVSGYLGEMAQQPDFYLKAAALGLIAQGRPVMPLAPSGPANEALRELWSRNGIETIGFEEGERIAAARPGSRILPALVPTPDGRWLLPDLTAMAVQARWEADDRAPLLALDEAQRQRGADWLAGLGVPRGAFIVALHLRTAATYDDTAEWSLNRHRQVVADTYGPALRRIAARGGWIVRLGDVRGAALPQDIPNLIELARLPDAEPWMDVYAVAASRFALCMASGPYSLAVALGVPAVCANWFPLGGWPQSGRDRFIFKRLVRDDGTPLSLSESLVPRLLRGLEPRVFSAAGLTVVDNDAEEIDALVAESLDDAAADPSQQAAFRRVGDPFGLGMAARVGSDFLARHPELLR